MSDHSLDSRVNLPSKGSREKSELRGVGEIGILVSCISGFSGLESHTIILFLEYGVYEISCVFLTI